MSKRKKDAVLWFVRHFTFAADADAVVVVDVHRPNLSRVGLFRNWPPRPTSLKRPTDGLKIPRI